MILNCHGIADSKFRYMVNNMTLSRLFIRAAKENFEIPFSKYETSLSIYIWVEILIIGLLKNDSLDNSFGM